MHNRHITWRFGAELQPVCREQDVELSSIVALNLQVMTFGICVPKRHLKTVFLNLLDHCCFGPKFRCENHAFWRPVHQKTLLSCPCQVRFHPCGRRSLKWPLNEGYPLPSKPSNFWATNIFFPTKITWQSWNRWQIRRWSG